MAIHTVLFGVLGYLIGSICIPVNTLQAQELKENRIIETYGESKESIVNELRWITKELREYHLKLNPKLALRAHELTRFLQNYELSFLNVKINQGFQDQASSLYSFSSDLLSDLVKIQYRQEIDQNPAYTQYLKLFIQVLYEADLPQVALKLLKNALQSSKMTSSQYEDFLTYLFQNSSMQLSKAQLMQSFQRYQSLCSRRRSTGSKLGLQAKPCPSPLMRYLYAKNLYFLQSFEQAKSLFVSFKPQSDFYLRSQYFLALILLKQDRLSDALRIFETVIKQVQSLPKSLNLPVSNQPQGQAQLTYPGYRVDENLNAQIKNPKLTIRVKITPTSDQKKASSTPLSPFEDASKDESGFDRLLNQSSGVLPPKKEQKATRSSLLALFNLALGRLKVMEGQLEQAWQAYRQVPSMSAQIDREIIQKARWESVYLLTLQNEYMRAVDLIDEILSENDLNQNYVDLSLWQAELMIKGSGQSKDKEEEEERIQRALEIYQDLDTQLKQKLTQLRTASESDLLFPPMITNWIGKEIIEKVRELQEKIDLQELEFRIKVKAVWKELEKALKQKNFALIGNGKALLRKKIQQLKSLQLKIKNLKQYWNQRVRTQYPRFNQYSAEELLEKTKIITQRIQILAKKVIEHEKSLFALLPKSLQQESKEMNQINRKIQKLRTQFKGLSGVLKKQALAQVDTNLAQIKLGRASLAFLKKEQAGENLQKLRDARLEEIRKLRPLEKQSQQAQNLPIFLDRLIPLFEAITPVSTSTPPLSPSTQLPLPSSQPSSTPSTSSSSSSSSSPEVSLEADLDL